jgi:FKBP-type peptidyl-prolyl cis-trans isomerase FkpA
MFTLKKIVLSTSLALCVSGMAMAQPLVTDEDKESYSMGASVGTYVAGQIMKQDQLGAKMNLDLVIAGFEEAIRGKSQLKSEEVIRHLNARAEKLNKLHEAEMEKIRQKNAAEGKAFLEENSKKKGVVVTSSGLQYEVISEGTGIKPLKEDVVTVDYVGQLIDGTVIESTYKENKSAQFVLFSVVPGLEEGLQLMNQGARYRFTIPAHLAYGKDGIGQIPPESVVIFEVQLVKVEKVTKKSGHGMGGMGGMGGMMGGMGMMNPHGDMPMMNPHAEPEAKPEAAPAKQ